MSLLLRYMRLPDVPTVASIDAASFNPPWSAQSYQFEVSDSNYSHMVVLEDCTTPHTTLIDRLLATVGLAQPARGEILGYGGLWHLAGEAHISTIAVTPNQRGRRYGELLLLAMCVRSVRLRAGTVVLEVRVSNTVAQNLYHKHGFEVTGTKPRYYQSDGEDAYAMRLTLSAEAGERVQDALSALLAALPAKDDFTREFPPRR